MEEVPLTEGFRQLLNFLKDNNIDVIVISGGNTLFLSWIIHKHDLPSILNTVFANKGEVINDQIQLSDHHQHECESCE